MGRERGRGMAVIAGLIPPMLALLGPLSLRAGRLGWLTPLCALPAGALMCWIWRRAAGRSLSRLLEESFGLWAGRGVQLLYLLWGLWLMSVAARRYVRRLLITAPGENVRWLYLGAALLLVLWLSRGEGVILLRTGRLLFGALTAAVILGAALSLPALKWENLWPPDPADWTGLGAGALTVAGLAGWGIFGLYLPGEERERPWGWTALGCGLFAGLLAVTLGTFGPALTGRMEEPFLLLLAGAAAPGVFRRGEAALASVLTLGDFMLLALLLRGCACLWRGLFPGRAGRGVWLVAGAAFWWAGAYPVAGARGEPLLLWGGVLFGIGLPTLAVLTEAGRKALGKEGISCVKKGPEEADVAEEEAGEKSYGKNEKKC